MAITITAGHITSEAEAFMRTHGVTIESTLGLLVVTLPEAAEIAYPILAPVQSTPLTGMASLRLNG